MKKIITIAASIAAMMAVSCTGEAPLAGEWEVVTIKGEEVTGTLNKPAITIDDKMTGYSGETGANLVNGPLTVKGDEITFGEAAMTRMMADPATMDVEMNYIEVLNTARKVSVADGTMTLMDEDGNELMTLKKN